MYPGYNPSGQQQPYYPFLGQQQPQQVLRPPLPGQQPGQQQPAGYQTAYGYEIRPQASYQQAGLYQQQQQAQYASPQSAMPQAQQRQRGALHHTTVSLTNQSSAYTSIADIPMRLNTRYHFLLSNMQDPAAKFRSMSFPKPDQLVQRLLLIYPLQITLPILHIERRLIDEAKQAKEAKAKAEQLKREAAHIKEAKEKQAEQDRKQSSPPKATDEPLKPTPAPIGSDKEAASPAAKPRPSKQLDFNEFESGLSPPNPWDQPTTIKDDLQELGPSDDAKDSSASRTATGSRAELLLPGGAPPATIAALEELLSSTAGLANITDADRVAVFNSYDSSRATIILRLVSRYSELGFEPPAVLDALRKSGRDRDDKIDDDAVLSFLVTQNYLASTVEMKLPPFYSYLLAILFQALFASTSSGEGAALKREALSGSKTTPVVDKSLRKGTSKHGKDSVMVKEDRPKSLSELLPKTLVEIVIGYFNDIYPILVSTHNWSCKDEPRIAVDSARVYVMACFDGIRGLNHSSANLKDDEHCYTAFGDPQWTDYSHFSSSRDGRYVSFSHSYRISTNHQWQAKRSVKWLTKGSDLEDGRLKHLALGSANLSWGLLSEDGQTVFSYSSGMGVTHAYQTKEEAGKSPVAFMRLEFKGYTRAVSGKGNRVMVTNGEQLEIRDIGKDASRLACQISRAGFINTGALNEDGSEAAFVKGGELRIVDVGKAARDKIEPAIVTVKIPVSLGRIDRLVYSGGGKLHVLHNGNRVSLFDPLTKTLIPIEVPQEGQKIARAAMSPNADYLATLQHVSKEERGERGTYRTTVRRKPTKDDWRDLFGHEAA